ncbi:MAG: GMP/IMP nucleotidase [Oceanobacter sp.]
MTTFEWDQIQTVLLDMDGTLLDLHFDNFFWLEHLPHKYGEHRGMTQDEALAELSQSFIGLRGTLEWYCLDFWSELTGLPIARLKEDVTHKIRFRPHVIEFLEHLRVQGKRLVIVTNAHRDSVNLKMRHTGLDRYIDRIISSHDYRFPKESAEFWNQLHADEAFDIEHTLLIDDSRAVLESARQWGIKHLLMVFHPDSQKEPVVDKDFPGFLHFNEIVPTKND